MVFSRLFSGLANSVRDGEWKPSGVPAIYKLLEGLAAEPDIELTTVLAVKDPLGPWACVRRSTNLKPIGRVEILPWRPRRWLQRLGLDGKLREIDQLIRIFRLLRRDRPDVCYFSNANFVQAAVTARLRLAPVVLRFLGLHPEQKRVAAKNRGLQKWLYRSPFVRAVCSKDGSGGELFLPKLLHPATPLSVLLNGVDPVQPSAKRVAELRRIHTIGGRPVVLFVGRLEPNKGILEFVEGVSSLLERKPGAVDAIVVGDGSLRDQAVALARGRIRFTGALEHADVAAFFAFTDIYVSLNRFGSLSNANLEAAAAGTCLIVLQPDPENGTDVESFDVFPEGAVVRLPRQNLSAALCDALAALIENPADIETCRERALSVAKTRFQSWDRRIATEIELIREAAESGRQGRHGYER